MQQGFVFIGYTAMAARSHRYLVLECNLPCYWFVAHLVYGVGGGADECDPVVMALLRKVCVLGQETITRMQRIALCSYNFV